MTNLEIQSIFLADEIAELELQLKNHEGNLWAPKIGEHYFRVSDIGYIQKYINKNEEIDLALFALNAYYQTQAQAESELNARQVKAELEQCEGARKFIKDKCNHYFVLVNNLLNLTYDYNSARASIPVYFDTQVQIHDAKFKVGDGRILKAMQWIHLGDKL